MINEPIFFEQNRVRRVYQGGKLFGGFFGDSSEDGYFPEEWVASAVEAINSEPGPEKEGVSRTVGEGRFFDDLLAEHKREMLGSAEKLRILVKVLDSAIRLPAQAHPDKPYSRAHFQSEYGKTESWIILDTRPGAKLYFGFREGVTREIFSEAIDRCETDKNALEDLMCSVTPRKGDVFLVPAKTVHAIGAGCLILEIQEPTDFTIQPEHWCGEYKLSEREMYLGLTKEEALDCFEFSQAPDSRKIPRLMASKQGQTVENLIGEADTDCFVVNRIRLTNGSYTPNLSDSFGIYIVTEGAGTIEGEGYKRELKKGDYFFLPCCLMNRFRLSGTLECIECY